LTDTDPEAIQNEKVRGFRYCCWLSIRRKFSG